MNFLLFFLRWICVILRIKSSKYLEPTLLIYSREISTQVISAGFLKYSFIHFSIGIKKSSAFSGISRPVILTIPFGSRMNLWCVFVGNIISDFLTKLYQLLKIVYWLIPVILFPPSHIYLMVSLFIIPTWYASFSKLQYSIIWNCFLTGFSYKRL